MLTAPLTTLLVTKFELLLGDSTKARQELGWKPKTSFKNLVDKMVSSDILSLDGEE